MSDFITISAHLGNDGFRARGRKSKFTTIPSYLRAYVDGYNRKGPNDSAYLFSDPIAGAPARPYGTLFEGSSFAYRFRNVLVISVDAFRTAGSGKKDYIDRSNGYGGEGMITCDVSGDHLAWFEDVLRAAKSDSSIKHIFVESHIPIIQPVRTQQSSGQFMDDADQSAFWKVMNTYGVDIYFAGDVHSTTASKTKESNSNLVQIISSSRFFAGFLTVHVTNDSIEVKHHNEFGEKSRFNNQYIENGMLTITKTSRGEVIQIESYGELELLNDALPLIHLDFENLYPLSTRQVNGLTSNGKLIPDSINIGGVACNESLKNHGSFGKHYDAQTGNIQLVQGRRNGGFSAQMSPDSRLAIFGSGPLGAGRIVSVSMWFKTDHDQDEMVLCHYGSFWGPVPKKKDHLLLTLGRGVPILYIRPGQAYSVAIDSIADGNWHHVALTMPKQNCLSAEIQLFIDGDEYPLESITPWSNDKNVFFLTSGRMSFGGLGYASKRTKEYYMDKLPYEGELDDIKVWSRTLSPGDIRGVSISCDDDVDYKFTLKNGRSVKCGWIQANKKTLKRRERYCYDKSDKESASDIANACPKSCGFCSHD